MIYRQTHRTRTIRYRFSFLYQEHRSHELTENTRESVIDKTISLTILSRFLNFLSVERDDD